MIVADTGAVLALLDSSDKHHAAIRGIYERDPDHWILPWAVLPEVDYLLASNVSRAAGDMFLRDLASGAFVVDWGEEEDLDRAAGLCRKYRALQLGLVDTVVMAVAERLRAAAIATFDVRHFGAVALSGQPRLLPRDT